MNYQLAIVGALTFLALLAHIFGGIRESLSVAPAKLADRETVSDFESLERNKV